MPDEQLRKLLGNVGYALVKPLLRSVNIKFDIENKRVCVTRSGKEQAVSFEQIEQAVNENQ